MRDLMEMANETQKGTTNQCEHQKKFTEEFIKELVKEGSAEIAPHLTCEFDLIKMEYRVTLRFPVSAGRRAADMDTKSYDCATQHIATLLKQSTDGRTADFAEPCVTCPHEGCKGDWQNILDPIIRQSNIKFNLACQASLKTQKNAPVYPVNVGDIQRTLENQIELLSRRIEEEFSLKEISCLNERLCKTIETLFNITRSHPRAGVEKPEET